MKPGKTIMGKILGNKRDDLFLMANLLQNRGLNDFTYYSIQLYDKPDKKLVKEARKLMKLREFLDWKLDENMNLSMMYINIYDTVRLCI